MLLLLLELAAIEVIYYNPLLLYISLLLDIGSPGLFELEKPNYCYWNYWCIIIELSAAIFALESIFYTVSSVSRDI